MSKETPAEALVRFGNQFLLANLFQASGPLAGEILRKDDELDPANEDDLATAMRRATDAVANEYGRMSTGWCRGSEEPAIAKLISSLIARNGQA